MNLFFTILLWLTYFISLYFLVYWLLVFFENRFYFKREESCKRELSRFPLVSVIIPALNEEVSITKSANSVLSLNYPKNKLEIILINDGSTDSTLARMQAISKHNPGRRIVIIHNDANIGKGASINKGIKIAKGEFLACLDADSYIDKDTLKKQLYVYETSPKELAIVTPAMKVYKPKGILRSLQWLEYVFAIFAGRLMSSVNTMTVAPGPFSLYRTALLRKVGGFDEHNPAEDMEVAYRMQKFHYKIKQCYDGYVYTNPPRTIRELSHQRRNRWYRGSIHNLIKYRKMVFNKEYGDLGVMQLPHNAFLFFLSSVVVGFFLYHLLYPLAKLLHNLSIVNFDIMTYINTFKFNFKFLDMNFTLFFIIGLFVLIALLTLYFAHKNARESVLARVFYIIPYILIYYIFIGMLVVASAFDFVFGKSWSWRNNTRKK